ncbi:6153_t:CDS:2 [Diversispora eburnea]|uniref:6153_t:CDS:1 n=1 Tax=Diversispora eburnea TaxID=1213867 RepID=A0A9N9CCC0_9GLOM|nr:6153_t:CDS:2 [Diversispora eburnea]
MGVKTANRSTIYLKGIYPAEDFKIVKKYDIRLVMTIDDSLIFYLRKLLPQVEAWLMAGKIQKLVMAIIDCDSRETLERWQFDIQVIDDFNTSTTNNNNNNNNNTSITTKKEKTIKEIQTEIREIIRQITSSVSFLPTLIDKCTFNILAYTDKDAEVPVEWGDSDPHIIENAEQVRLRSFSTNYHRVDSMVSYKLEDL